MIKCEICGKEVKSNCGLTAHMKLHNPVKIKPFECEICGKTIGGKASGLHIKKHGLTAKDYYDRYLKKDGEDLCINCNNKTKFRSITVGYANICSQDCQRHHVWNNLSEDAKNKSILKNSDSVKKSWTNKSKEEQSIHQSKARLGISKKQFENNLLTHISRFYDGQIKTNCRSLIYPYEIDFYIPDLGLAVEYNGNYWHSTIHKAESYHLDKSMLCREKGVRLIHIYEFENFDKQMKLLADLLNGVDNYSKNDFNKNNLIDVIPKPIIIYEDTKYTIYGAGELVSG